MSSSLVLADKSYELTFQMGWTTDTLDKTGRTLKNTKVCLEPSFIEKTLKKNLGWMDLTVPQFSAVKFQGKKLYEYARSGQDAPCLQKTMYFYGLKILSIHKTQVKVQLSCKKGGYIRAWTSWIGKELGVGACLVQLKRLACLPFHLNQSLLLKDFEMKCRENIEKAMDFAQKKKAFIPVKQIQS